MTDPTAFITGNSTGLGLGLTRALLARGWAVRGTSRRGCPATHPRLADARADLADFAALPAVLDRLLDGTGRLDLVILNAGILGEIRDLHETSLEDVRRIMDVNLWANKVIMDWLHASGIPVTQVVMMSSGAAVNGNRGWGGYALSKAALNMLARLYAHELPATHISAIAPGLIDSAMMDYLCEVPDPARFTALGRLRAARGTEDMPAPDEAAERVLGSLPRLLAHPSGSFVDIRRL